MGVPHPPITWEYAVAIGVRFASTLSWEMGVGVLLCFDCYLRESELLRDRLTVADVLLPGNSRGGSVFAGRCGLRLGATKTGREQFVEVLRPAVITLLSSVVENAMARGSPPTALLFDVSPSVFLRAFKEAAAALCLDPRVVVHSCRHGGATSDFLRGLDIAFIQHRGRWASVPAEATPL